MAKVRFYKVNVTMNPMAAQIVSVPEWEVGVLQAQWGDDAQVIEDDSSPFIQDVRLPDPRDEFERLAQRYGPKHSEAPYVAGVFGNFGPGVNALRDAIARSTKPLPEPFIEVEPVVAGDVLDVGDDDEGGDLESDDFADLSGDVVDGAEAAA